MDYRLVPYIKKYLNKGYTLEQIKQSLLQQGIPEEDIKQASIYAMEEGRREINKQNKKIWFLPVIIVILIGFSGYYFKDPIKIYATKAADKLLEEKNITQQEKCDIDCMISNADNCEEGATEFNSQTNLGGIVITTITRYEIINREKCILKIKIIDKEVMFSDQLKEQALANGITEEELTIQLEESRRLERESIGKEAECIFINNANLREFLQKTKEERFNSQTICNIGEPCRYMGDWTLGECSGSLLI
ncbi:MAG: hypothetical protein KatS3mg002_0098 [Candidatus Woesearchaeota archaeon]|nr:MAG: hypothetical protein KatS3mg002_0098 [Candidatus Woesearchaeota archaeon]